jgi:hypothetical protein
MTVKAHPSFEAKRIAYGEPSEQNRFLRKLLGHLHRALWRDADLREGE